MTTQEFLAAASKVKLTEPTFNEYKLMYNFGAWISHKRFAAEDDAEAIRDADEYFAESRLQNWQHGVKLFCGNRIVKVYR